MLVLSEVMICSDHTLASQILTICLQSSIYERMTHSYVFYQVMVNEQRERERFSHNGFKSYQLPTVFYSSNSVFPLRESIQAAKTWTQGNIAKLF
jgi:hypothetical protein